MVFYVGERMNHDDPFDVDLQTILLVKKSSVVVEVIEICFLTCVYHCFFP